MALDMTTFDAALKTLYTTQKVQNLTYKKNPFLAMLKKNTNFVGRNKAVPLIYGHPQGRSATFATAQTNKTSTKIDEFLLTRIKDYSLADIDAETALASRNNAGAFLAAMKTEIDGAMKSFVDSLCTGLFRDGSGAIGKVNNSNVTTTACDLVTDQDARNFEVGMEIVACDTKTGGTVRTGNLLVSKVDRNAATNQITFAENMDTGISAIAQNDFLYVEGDYDAKVSGLEAWMPTSSTATAFFGMDRSLDWVRLGGNYYDGSSDTILDAILQVCTYIANNGGQPDTAFCSFDRFNDLVTILGASVQREQVQVGRFGFSAIKIHTSSGDINIIPDRSCQADRVWVLQMDTWALESLDDCPQLLDQDGLRVMRNASSDSYEVRVGGYYQLSCNAPGYNGSATVPTT